MSISLDGMTDRTRKVLRIAAAYSRQLAHRDIEPQDLLDALAQTGGTSDHVLEEMDYQRKKLPVMFADTEHVVCASETLRLIVARAREQSLALGHDYIGTDHFLLALAYGKPELSLDYNAMRGLRSCSAGVRPNDRPPPTDPKHVSTSMGRTVESNLADALPSADAADERPQQDLVQP